MLEMIWEALPKKILITMFYLYVYIFIKMDVPEISDWSREEVARIQSHIETENSQWHQASQEWWFSVRVLGSETGCLWSTHWGVYDLFPVFNAHFWWAMCSTVKSHILFFLYTLKLCVESKNVGFVFFMSFHGNYSPRNCYLGMLYLREKQNPLSNAS